MLLEIAPVRSDVLEAMVPWNRTRYPNWTWPHLHPYAREYAWAVDQLGGPDGVRGQHILDAGGSGSSLSAVLAGWGAESVLVADRGDQGLRPYPADRVDFIECDLRDTGMVPGSFDQVVSVSAVEHNPWEDQVQIVRHLLHLLVPGGRLVLTLPAVRERDRAWYEAGKWPGHTNWGCVYLWTHQAAREMAAAVADLGRLRVPLLMPDKYDAAVERLFIEMHMQAPRACHRPYQSMGLTWTRMATT